MANHHGDGFDNEANERFAKMAAQLDSAVGKQNEYPEGKMHESDEGAINFAVTHANGKVVVNFGTPVAWLGMDPHQAMTLASYLTEHASQARIIGSNRHERRARAAKHKATV